MADILLEYIDEPLDRLKVPEYLLYHDLVEVCARDAKFNDPQESGLKHEKERAPMNRIVAILPNSKRYGQIMQEYELRETRGALFAKAVDCLDAYVRDLNDDKKIKMMDLPRC